MNYETMLEEMAEASLFGSIIHRCTAPNKNTDTGSSEKSAENKSCDEGRDQFRAMDRTSNANKISNRETIAPTTSPIALAGVSSTPRDATNSSTPVAQRIAQPTSNRQVAGSNPAGCANPFPSGNSGFNELCRISSQPDNLAGFVPVIFSFKSSIGKFPTAQSLVSDNSKLSEGQAHGQSSKLSFGATRERSNERAY